MDEFFIMSAKPEPSSTTDRLPADLVFLSPDRAQAQRVLTCLRHLGQIHWEQSPVPAKLAKRTASAVLLLDFSPEQAATSAQLMANLTALTPSAAVIAVGSTSHDGTACVLAALRAGVRGFIDLDAPNLIDDAHAAIEQAMRQREQQRHHALTPAPIPETARGRIILVLGVRTGVGTSTLVAHLGCMAQHRYMEARGNGESSRNHVVAMDLSEPGGDLALYLNVQSDFEVGNAIDNAGRLDATLSRTALPRHESDMAVLSRTLDTPPPSDSDADFGLLLERLGTLFDVVLIDAGGTAPSQLSAMLVNAAHETWLVADQGLATMVSLDSMVRTVRQCGAEPARVHLVMNRCESESGLTPEQTAERFKLPLLAALPDRGSRLRTCANSGKLLCDTSPHDRYLLALKPMLDRILLSDDPASHDSWLKRARKLWRS